MSPYRIPYEKLKTLCEDVFAALGFAPEDASAITDVLLVDLYGIEFHGVQRLMRYYKAVTGGRVKVKLEGGDPL